MKNKIILAIVCYFAAIGQPTNFSSFGLEWDYDVKDPENFVLRYQAVTGTNVPVPNVNWPIKVMVSGTNRATAVTFPTGSYAVTLTAVTGTNRSDFSNVVILQPLPAPVLRIK